MNSRTRRSTGSIMRQPCRDYDPVGWDAHARSPLTKEGRSAEVSRDRIRLQGVAGPVHWPGTLALAQGGREELTPMPILAMLRTRRNTRSVLRAGGVALRGRWRDQVLSMSVHAQGPG